MKILWFDTETTGLDPIKHEPIQIAGLVEIDGYVEEEFNFRCQPINWENVSAEALAINGLSEADLRSCPDPKEAKAGLEKVMSRYVKKFDKGDKFFPAGYNCVFDLRMMENWYKKLGDPYWYSWTNHYAIDPLALVNIEAAYNGLKLENHKLATLCNHFEVKIEAHEALSDIKATRELFKKLYFRMPVGM